MNCLDVGSGTTVTETFNSGVVEDDSMRTVIARVRMVNNVLQVAQLVHETIYRNYSQRLVGDWNSSTYYFYGDTVTVRYAAGGGYNFLETYVFAPYLTHPSSYAGGAGPFNNIDPRTHTPDPWWLISRCPVDGDWATGVFDITKPYLRIG